MLAPLSRLLKIPPARRLLAPHQLRFLGCTAKRRTNCSGRRSGKTFAAVVWLTEDWASRPGQSSIFCALSADHAERIAWDAVNEVNSKLGWGATYNGVSGAWTWPNAFTLYMVGCKDRRQANALRGIPKIYRVVVDESGQIPDPLLEYLVKDVIEPALADTNGDLCLTGTPADTGVGFFEDEMVRCETLGSHFCSTAADNPHLAIPGGAYIQRMLAERFGGDEKNATFRREYLGHRVQEEGVLIYRPPVDLDGEFYEPAPPPSNYTAMGLDVGWGDGFGFVVGRSRSPKPGVHILEAYRETELTLPRAAAIAERFRSQYGVAEIFVDSQGYNGSTICNTLAQAYGLPARPADKRARRMRIEQVRTMLDSRTLRGSAGRCVQLLEEWRGLPWNVERDNHREGYVDECTDATQYLLEGPGFTQLTEWRPEPTPEQEYAKRVAEITRARRLRTRGGRR